MVPVLVNVQKGKAKFARQVSVADFIPLLGY
jgi:hypothetical protein